MDQFLVQINADFIKVQGHIGGHMKLKK